LHKVQQRGSRVSIYTNYEDNDNDFRGDDDGDVGKDGDEDTPPQIKGELVAMMVSISLGGGHGVANLPSPEEEEGFRFHRWLKKIREKSAVDFSSR
jgi:hypothetical protein